MAFCGQCGQLLAPDSTVCPRCGSVTEPELAVEDLHTNDPTIVSTSYTASPASQPGTQRPITPPHQEKLVLGPYSSESGFGAVAPNEPTGMMPHQPPISPSVPEVRAAHPGLPAPQAGSPSQGGSNYRTAYPSFPPGDMGYSPVPEQFGGIDYPPSRRGRGTVIPLLVFFFVILLVLGAAAVFIAKPDLLKGITGSNATPTVVNTPTDQARNLIQQYYQDINNQDYQDAYNFWGSDYQGTHSLSNFSAGYAHTRHDDITINRLTPLSDGTVKADITIAATEENSGGTVSSTYQGTYIIGQENGTWKFLSGSFNKVG